MELLKTFLCIMAVFLFVVSIAELINLIWNFDIYHVKRFATAFILLSVFHSLAKEAIKDE